MEVAGYLRVLFVGMLHGPRRRGIHLTVLPVLGVPFHIDTVLATAYSCSSWA